MRSGISFGNDFDGERRLLALASISDGGSRSDSARRKISLHIADDAHAITIIDPADWHVYN